MNLFPFSVWHQCESALLLLLKIGNKRKCSNLWENTTCPGRHTDYCHPAFFSFCCQMTNFTALQRKLACEIGKFFQRAVSFSTSHGLWNKDAALHLWTQTASRVPLPNSIPFKLDPWQHLSVWHWSASFLLLPACLGWLVSSSGC